ncbi:MAG: hypothetical protein JW738_06210 [Actinobacteria bacterium]|nr:hypothetical protein [Actinomycetota bacterium]
MEPGVKFHMPMENISVCEVCGVPKFISTELHWGGDGTITTPASKDLRWVFFESDNIDALFNGLEELIGVPLDNIVIESRRREVRYYMSKKWPPEDIRDYLDRREGEKKGAPVTPEETQRFYESAKLQVIGVQNIGRVYGYGEMQPADSWEKGDKYPWRYNIIRNSYSVLMNVAVLIGAVEAFEKKDMWAEYKEIGENTFIVSSIEGEHPVSLKERLWMHKYEPKPGDISYNRCPGCGLPEDVSRCVWFMNKGIIYDPLVNRRMALFGPSSVDSILKDLEFELGESVPSLVIEAQRRITREEMSGEDWKRRAPDFKRMISTRGLGNLVKFEGDKTYLTLTIQNSCLTLIMVGAVQALVELALKWERSDYEYELKEDGDLVVTIKSR